VVSGRGNGGLAPDGDGRSSQQAFASDGDRVVLQGDGETMLGTKLDWLCNAIVALVIVLALGLVWTKPQYKAPDRLTVAEWTERTLNEIFHKWWDLNKKSD
jgi:hypothetical protein